MRRQIWLRPRAPFRELPDLLWFQLCWFMAGLYDFAFGWKISSYIYHTIGLAASGFLRAKGIPCSLYIDYRLNGELLTPSGPWSQHPLNRSREYRLLAAKAALFVVRSILVELGYTIGIKKSVLSPATALEYLVLLSIQKNCPFWYLFAGWSLLLHWGRTFLPVSLGWLSRPCDASRGSVFHFR